MEKLKILVTGGAGFIGSSIVDRLIADNYEVAVVDDLSSGMEENINKKARFYKLNIQDPEIETVFKKEHPDIINHQAAQIDVRRSIDDPLYDAGTNVLGTINILQNCIRHKIKKVIFASSGGAVYGEQQTFPASESHPLRPISPYGITKMITEQYLYYYKTVFGLDYTSLRYSNVYGPRQDPFGEAGAIAIFIQKMLDNEQVVINGSGEQTRDFVFVEDVVEANILAIKNSFSESIFNIGTGTETTINEIFRNLKEITGLSTENTYGPPKAGEQLRSVIECTKAEKILNWRPEISLSDGLKRTCEYFKRKNEEHRI